MATYQEAQQQLAEMRGLFEAFARDLAEAFPERTGFSFSESIVGPDNYAQVSGNFTVQTEAPMTAEEAKERRMPIFGRSFLG
jgi:hypothetical protein